MASWNDFTTAISAIPTAFKSLTGGGAYLSEDEIAKEQVLHNTVKQALSSIDKELSSNPLTNVGKKLAAGSADLLLKGAIKLNNNVISPYITRPMSTLGLLTDTSSPLYQKGEYESGFQFKDIKAAYNRSAKVSTFQALTKSDMIPLIKPLSSVILSTGDIDLDEVDLWDDSSIQKNYVDNAVGRWFTGIGDFVVGNAALTGVGKAIGIGAKAGGARAGLYTARKTIDDLAKDMDDGILYATTNGTKGTQTVSGTHMQLLAESKDYGFISGMVEKYSTNGNLVNLIRDASTGQAVKDLILADKGDLSALGRLAATAPDELFELSGTASQLQAKAILTGDTVIPVDKAVERLKSAYDAAIKKNPQFQKLRDAFFDDNYKLTPGGKAYMPIEPKIGRNAFIKGTELVQGIKASTRFREYDQLGEFLELKLPGRTGAPLKTLIKLTSKQAEYKPLGFVTFSGVRPLDGRVELNAFMNNLKIFNDGNASIEVAPQQFKKVADIRRDFEEQYMKSIGVNEIETLDNIDMAIGKMLAYKVGIYSDTEISGIVSNMRNRINTGLAGLKANGYAITHDGRQLETNAQTIRQLEESYRFSPWDSIEKNLNIKYEPNRLKGKASVAQDLAANAFRDINRVWTFDVLVRPMYIIKQSIAEPIVSATIAQGMNFIWKDVFGTIKNPGMSLNAVKNLGNKVQYGVRKTYNRKDWKAAEDAVLHQQKAYSIASQIKDNLQVEVEDLLRGTSAPSVQRTALAAARKELDAANRLLDKVELDLRSAMVPIGVQEAIPNLTVLERRMAFLNAKPSLVTKQNKAAMVAAQRSVANYKNIISKMATNKKVIRDADTALENAYKDIDNILAQLKPALKEQADVWGKNARFKERFYARDSQTRVVAGQVVAIDSFIAGGSPFSAALRAETSNARTVELNALGNLSVKTRQDILSRKVPTDVVKVSQPEYFAELQHIANQMIRQDPLMDQILAGTSMADLKKWAATEPGLRYLENFDIYEAKQVPTYLADKVAMIERTFPSQEARLTILQREVTAQELQTWLAPYADELYDIAPTNFAYGVADSAPGGGSYAAISQLVDRTSASIFKFMSRAENPIRNAFFDNAALDAMARKASALVEQGIDMTPAQWNALRQSAGREAIQELEKTVYTIRRQNRLLHNARTVVAFPTATINAFYRYGRLAVKNPVRATGFAYNYGRLFQNFGVDENGNPTEDINAITHIIMPGTKELGWGYQEEGLALNAKSIGFLLNQPSPSFISAYSVGKLMQKFPGTEEGIKKIMNAGGANLYETWFPYGAPTSITKIFTPPYLNALINSAMGNPGRADYLASWKSVYNYHKMLVEMGIEDKFPSDEMIEKETSALWANKFLSGFISLTGVPYKVETNPMRLSTNLYYRLVEKYTKQGLSTQAARDAAGDEMINTMGTGFMLDRVTASGTNRNVSLPATYEGYKRIFEDNDELVGELAGIEPGEIGLVGLLTADLSKDPAEQSNNILGILANPNLTLPGTSKRISDLRLTPQEAEAERIKNRTWRQYSLVKDALNAKITDGKTLRSHPELKAVLDTLASGALKEQSPEWYNEYQLAAVGDKSYKYAKAFATITTNEKFMAQNKGSQFWEDARLFTRARNIFTAYYQSLPDYDSRKSLTREAYNAWVEETSQQWDPNLATLVQRYFENDTLKAVE